MIYGHKEDKLQPEWQPSKSFSSRTIHFHRVSDGGFKFKFCSNNITVISRFT